LPQHIHDAMLGVAIHRCDEIDGARVGDFLGALPVFANEISGGMRRFNGNLEEFCGLRRCGCEVR
jgi:hypothetical protein